MSQAATAAAVAFLCHRQSRRAQAIGCARAHGFWPATKRPYAVLVCLWWSQTL